MSYNLLYSRAYVFHVKGKRIIMIFLLLLVSSLYPGRGVTLIGWRRVSAILRLKSHPKIYKFREKRYPKIQAIENVYHKIVIAIQHFNDQISEI